MSLPAWRLAWARPILAPYSLSRYLPALNSLRSFPIRAYSDARAEKNLDIHKLVPQSGLVSIIDHTGAFAKDVAVKRYVNKHLDKQRHELVVVKYLPAEDADPAVVCKVVPISTTTKKDKPPKPKKHKPSGIKDIPVSWNIALSDLTSQKKQAIKSVLGRGHTLQLVLDAKAGQRRREISELDLEKRTLLIQKCRDLCSEWGSESHKPQGTIYGRMTLSFAPNQSAGST